MTVYRPPALDKNVPIVDPSTGRISPYLQRFWQNLSFTAGEGANQITNIDALQTTVNGHTTQIAALNTGKVAKSTFSGWVLATGTLERTTFATYASPTISASPTQAEVQAISDAVQILSRRVAALVADLKT